MIAANNTNNLPSPRLEFEWLKTGQDWTDRICRYCLVLPLERLDCRAGDANGEYGVFDEWKVVIGETTVTGGPHPYHDGKVERPFRDGAHMNWDNKSLGGNLPMYAVCEDKFTELFTKE